MKRPCFEDLEIAARWLKLNEGGDGEADACSRVSTWLETYARESFERSAAREAGCTVKYLRKRLADRLAPTNPNPA